MTHKELATKVGMTMPEYWRDRMEFLQCEGYDEDGNEYETLADWIMRRRNRYQADSGEAMIQACERGEICGAS